MRTGRTLARAMVCSSALILGYAASDAAGADFAYDANLGLGHSDNIRRTSANEEDENIAAAGLNFSLGQTSQRLQADAIGSFSYAEYLDNTYDSELLGNFAGNARFKFVPQRFEWVATDNFGQVLSDPFAPPTPDNREDINYFSTGPDVTLAFGSRSRLRLGGRYSLVTYQDTPLDFDTVSGDAAWVRMLSSASNISLNVRTARTEYDQAALNGDYDQSEAFVSYDLTGARTRLAVDVGYSVLDRDAATRTEDGLLLRLNASRRLSASSTATLTAGHEFSNSGSTFAGMQEVGNIGLDTTPGRQTAQPFVSDSVALGWNFARNRTSFGLFASWTDQSYEDNAALDQTLTGFDAQLRRELSSNTSVMFHAQYSKAEFQQQNADYDDLNAGCVFAWGLSRNVSLQVAYDHLRRSSDVPTGDSAENRFWLSIGYGRGTPRTALVGPQFDASGGS